MMVTTTRCVRRAAACAALFAAFAAGAARADINAYNQAVKAGDYKTAAAEAKAVWSTFDKTSPATASVAREFGFSSYVAGDYAAAHDYGTFLKENGAKLPTPDDQPVISAVLLAAADYRLNPKSDRDGLASALEARVAAPGLDNISVLASEALYHGDWNEGAWLHAKKSTELAENLLDRGGGRFRARYDAAKIANAAAEFLASPAPRDYDLMVDVHNSIVADVDQASNEKAREALGREMYHSGAWANAIWAYVRSFATQTGSNIPVGVSEKNLDNPKSAIFPDIPDPRPICQGRIDLDNFPYPGIAEFRGVPGAVTLKLDMDDSGAVTHAEALASVPADVFADALVKASPTFHWKLKEGENLKTCRMRRTNYVFTVIFHFA